MNVIWMVFVCGVAMTLQAIVFRYFSLRHLKYTRMFSKSSVVEGEQVEVVEVLRNQKLLPVPWLRVESRISPFLLFGSHENLDVSKDQYHKSVFFLPAFKKVTRRHQVTCMQRGCYNLNSATMIAGDIFGMIQTSRQLELEARLYVYPRLLGEEDWQTPTQKWQGDVLMHRWIMPDPYLINGIREYGAGDTMRDIHWKATARTGRLQVKTHDYTAQPRLIIYLNIQPNESLWAELSEVDKQGIERAISLAATLAAKALEQGVEVGFFCNCMLQGSKTPVRVMPLSGRDQYDNLMQIFARLVLSRSLSFPSMLSEDADVGLSGMDILILSPYWSDMIEMSVENLRQRGNAVGYLPLSLTEVRHEDIA